MSQAIREWLIRLSQRAKHVAPSVGGLRVQALPDVAREQEDAVLVLLVPPEAKPSRLDFFSFLSLLVACGFFQALQDVILRVVCFLL